MAAWKDTLTEHLDREGRQAPRMLAYVHAPLDALLVGIKPDPFSANKMKQPKYTLVEPRLSRTAAVILYTLLFLAASYICFWALEKGTAHCDEVRIEGR